MTKDAPRSDLKTRVKLRLGGWLHPRATRRWQDFLARHACLQAQLQRHPVLAHKIYRPYLCTGLGCGARVRVLSEHYGFMHERGLLAWSCAAAERPHCLGQLPLKDGGSAALTLSAIHDGHREGELCLALQLAGQRLYSLSFVIRGGAQGPLLMVGRLQGLAGDEARQLVREATRQLHACRPTSLLITVVRHIAYLLGCAGVQLVSNRHRIALNPWRRWHISSDYDQLWTELGALPGRDGDYRLDCLREPGIDLASLPSKKRAEARRREALLRTACAGVAASLQAAGGVGLQIPSYPLAA